MCDIRMFRLAYADYELALSIFKFPRNDEMFVNAIAYHLQQSVEKLLRAFLECTGVTVPNTHDIDKHVFEINGLKMELRDELKDVNIKEKLRGYFSKNYEPEDEFEWNCYYQIYHKKLE